MTRSRWSRLCVAFISLAVLGCRDLTEVEAPDVRQPDDYATAAGASALATGAISRFNLAYAGRPAGGGQVTATALISDELFVTINSQDAWDRREPAEPVESGLYGPLQTARINLLTAIRALRQTAPDSTARIGQLLALTGYTEVFLAESYCSGVPLGDLDAEFRPVYGQPLTTEQMYEEAMAGFDSALVYAADSARIAQLAAVGRGRALLNLGRFAEAAQAVASVPTDYVYRANFVPGTITGTNGLSENTGQENLLTVPEREGANGLNWRTANDPRVPLLNRSPELIGADRVTEVWVFLPYQPNEAPIPLATGVEARLIEAEAALQAGNAGTWLELHNALRATVSGLEPLTDPGSPDARVDLHFRERAFWLFLTGHRHGDLRRLVRQYGRDAETVFPTGLWREGINYGTATNLAMPGAESNNPHYTGCLSRAA